MGRWRARAVVSVRMRTAIVTTLLLACLAACSSGDDGGAVGDVAPVATPATDSTTTTSIAPTTTARSTTTPNVTSAPSATDDSLPSVVSSAPELDADPPVTPSGYELVAATVTAADGEVCDVCLWLADTADTRRQGLMGVTDLGDGDGMAFVYPAPHTGTFWMKNTLLPLSIAFFDDQGTFLDAFDMEPCTADPCPVYPTAADFSIAIETTQGDFGELGVGPGSRLELTDLSCP